MKKIFTLLALTISFSMNAQLTAVSEGGNTGQRLSTSNASNHGDIGSNAVDLSYSSGSSSTLSKLLLIDGKSYVMNRNGKQKIGVLAQEIQEVFPELVTEDDNEMLINFSQPNIKYY